MENNEFEYYEIFDLPVWRRPLLSPDTDYGDEDELTGFLWDRKTAPDDYVLPLELLQWKWKEGNLDTDCLDMQGWNVFSQKIKDALDKHMPIKYLQLIKTSIRNGKYPGFYLANVHQELRTFDEKLCRFGKFGKDGHDYKEFYGHEREKGEVDWDMITKVVLDTKALSKIPLEERLVYVSEENCRFILYHKSIVDIVKSVNPTGIQYLRIEDWKG